MAQGKKRIAECREILCFRGHVAGYEIIRRGVLLRDLPVSATLICSTCREEVLVSSSLDVIVGVAGWQLHDSREVPILRAGGSAPIDLDAPIEIQMEGYKFTRLVENAVSAFEDAATTPEEEHE